MKKLLAYLAFSFLVSLSAYAQSGIVTDFMPVCDSLSVLITERTGVEGNVTVKSIMKRGGSLDFYFTEIASNKKIRHRCFGGILGNKFE